MNASDRLVNGCAGLALLIGGGLVGLLFWPVGTIMILFAFGYFSDAFSKTYPERINRRRGPSACLEFGPTGPPVPEGTPPLQIHGKMIFPSAIRAITFYPASPHDLEISPKGIETLVPGSARGHHSVVRIESGEEIHVDETDDNSLRYWVLHYVASARHVAAGISLVDSE